MKRKVATIFLIVAIVGASFASGFFITKSQAVTVPLGFGGRLLAWVFCDCSASFWLFYAPLGSPTPFPGGPLGWGEYDTLTYAHYNVLTPGVWHLGLYLPFVQSCWKKVLFICVPLPVLGHEIMVGTSAIPAL